MYENSTRWLAPDTSGLRLQTLIRLRWLAVGGQIAALLFVAGALEFELPLGPCLSLVALSAWLNMFLSLRYPASRRIAPLPAVLLLAYDTVQLAGLLYLTGGLENPFVFLFLVPVVVSATALPLTHTLALAALAVCLATLLGFSHMPLPWRPEAQIALPFIYRVGVWVALMATLGFMTLYARRIAEETRQMSDALAATELVLAREQHLSALDGLAAAAAHELGTPLATIALVAKELSRDDHIRKRAGDDLQLLRTQADRCRDILAKLTSLGEEGDHILGQMPVNQLLEEVVAPHRDFDKEIRVVFDARDMEPPIIARNPAILYGLGNLVENAVDFARSVVTITASWTQAQLSIDIADDGPGIAPDLLQRLGEPYVTTRKGEGALKQAEGSGLGLGFFIAKVLLERSGARVTIANNPSRRGARATVSWPLAALN